MSIRFFLLLSVTLYLGLSHVQAMEAQRFTRIIGGEEALKDAYPWVVSLQESDGEYFCVGSLIAPEWVMTAAHCLMNATNTRVLEPEEMFVVVGDYLLTSDENDGQKSAVSEVIVHPEWENRGEYLFPDIGLVKLTTPINNIPLLPMVLEEDSDLLTPGTPAWVMGWGKITLSGLNSIPDILHHVKLPIVDQEVCEQAYADEDPILPTMICAGLPEGGKDACVGDSGAPLIVQDRQGQWQQIAVVSHGGKSDGPLCAGPDAYGVYTRLAAFTDFIHQHVQELPEPQFQYQGIWRSEDWQQGYFVMQVNEKLNLLGLIVLKGLGEGWLVFVGNLGAEQVQLQATVASVNMQLLLRADSQNDRLQLTLIDCEGEQSDCLFPLQETLILDRIF